MKKVIYDKCGRLHQPKLVQNGRRRGGKVDYQDSGGAMPTNYSKPSVERAPLWHVNSAASECH